MAFFDPLPVTVSELRFTDPDYEPLGPPRDLLGVTLAPMVVASTREAAVVLEAGWAYPEGLMLRFGVRIRRSISAEDGTYLSPTFHWHWPPQPPDAAFVNIGLRYPDGAKLTNTDAPNASGGLNSLGGSASSTGGSHEFFAWPAPRNGPVEVWTRWEAAQIPETHVVISLPVTSSAQRLFD